MSKYKDGCYDTTKGRVLIAKVLAGQGTMNYTRAAVGKGNLTDDQDPKTMETPADYVMDAKITAVTTPVDGECQITVQVSSKDVSEGFYCTGIVLYAEDPDDGEVPFTYMVLENEPEWIRPSSAIVGKLVTFDIVAFVGAVERVSAVIDPTGIPTVENVESMIHAHNESDQSHPNLQSHVKNTENPHGVTKEQVGLGNVDNTPDDQKNVASAGKLAAKHTIGLSGGATGTPTGFDGTGDILIPVTALNPDQLSKVVPVNKGGTGNTSVDTAPVAGSSKMVTSGGVYDALRKAETSNILINWDFRYPINQRGRSNYSKGMYAIDRWYNSSDAFVVDNGCISLHTTAIWQGMEQRIEEGWRWSGVPITFSVIYRASANFYRLVIRRAPGDTIGAVNLPASSQWSLASLTVVPSGTLNPLTAAIDNSQASVGDYIDIMAAKLEPGRTQTLAHKDGNNWVINNGFIQDKTVEFLRCARYFFRQNLGSFCRMPCAGVGATTADGSRIYLHLPVPMRANPTPSVSSRVLAGNYACQEKRITKFNWWSIDQNTLRLAPVTETGFSTSGAIVWIGSDTDGNYIDFNAEL